MIGSLSAVGDVVYAAEFTHKTTTGYMMKSGRKVFRYPKGTYTPVISDGRWLYLTGYSSITALRPIHLRALRQARRQARRKQAREAAGTGRAAAGEQGGQAQAPAASP